MCSTSLQRHVVLNDSRTAKTPSESHKCRHSSPWPHQVPQVIGQENRIPLLCNRDRRHVSSLPPVGRMRSGFRVGPQGAASGGVGARGPRGARAVRDAPPLSLACGGRSRPGRPDRVHREVTTSLNASPAPAAADVTSRLVSTCSRRHFMRTWCSERPTSMMRWE